MLGDPFRKFYLLSEVVEYLGEMDATCPVCGRHRTAEITSFGLVFHCSEACAREKAVCASLARSWEILKKRYRCIKCGGALPDGEHMIDADTGDKFERVKCPDCGANYERVITKGERGFTLV